MINNLPLAYAQQGSIGGEIGGQGGSSPSTLKSGGAEPPHFSNVYTLNILLKKPQTTVRRPQKHSLVVKNSKFSWGSMHPDPPRQLTILIPKA